MRKAINRLLPESLCPVARISTRAWWQSPASQSRSICLP